MQALWNPLAPPWLAPPPQRGTDVRTVAVRRARRLLLPGLVSGALFLTACGGDGVGSRAAPSPTASEVTETTATPAPIRPTPSPAGDHDPKYDVSTFLDAGAVRPNNFSPAIRLTLGSSLWKESADWPVFYELERGHWHVAFTIVSQANVTPMLNEMNAATWQFSRGPDATAVVAGQVVPTHDFNVTDNAWYWTFRATTSAGAAVKLQLHANSGDHLRVIVVPLPGGQKALVLHASAPASEFETTFGEELSGILSSLTVDQ